MGQFKTFQQYLTEMPESDAMSVQDRINQLVQRDGFKVAFTNHFKDRLAGRDDSVSQEELYQTFAKFFVRYKDMLEKLGDDHKDIDAVIKDHASKVNAVVDIDATKKLSNGRITVVGVTIMRKDNFLVPGGEKQFKV